MIQPLSLHVSGPQGQRTGFGLWLERLAASGLPARVLYSVNENIAFDVAKYSPDTKIVFRVQNETFQRLPGDFFTGDAAASARQWIAGTRDQAGRTQLDIWRLNPATWYDPLNEPAPGTVAQAQWLNTWTLEALRIGKENGIKLALFSFQTGAPEYALWQYLIPALQEGKRQGAILSLHCYNDPALIEYDEKGQLTQASVNNTFRHVLIYETLPEDARLPVVYSEASGGNGYGTGQTADEWIADLIACGQLDKWDQYLLSRCAYQLGGSESNCYSALQDYATEIVAANWEEPDIPLPEISRDGSFAAMGGIETEAGDFWYLDCCHSEPGYPVMRNQAQHAGGYAEALLYWKGKVYATNAFAEWYQATAESWVKVSGDPRLSEPNIPEPEPEPFWVIYPVGGNEAPRVTDPFNAPRTYANGKHEGIDCDAYQNAIGQNAPILAAQSGVVEYVINRAGISYGLHVVIRHPWGKEPDRYRTLYAHLSRADVKVGQTVQQGQIIGLAGRTGTSAVHLHFGVYDAVEGLKGYLRCVDCSALWPDGVIDPARVIRLPELPPINSMTWRGLHLRADGHSQQPDYQCLSVADLDAAKIMTNTDFQELANLKTLGISAGKIVLRLFWAGDNPALKDPARAFDEARAWLSEFYRQGGVYVEVHNEPNLNVEGMGWAWATPEVFGGWYEGVARLIRQNFPALKIGWPGLSPQSADVPGVCVADSKFVPAMQASLRAGLVDWIGSHCYWSIAAQMNEDANGRYYRRLLGYGRPVIITEFSNNGTTDTDTAKGQQYAQYYASLESGVLGAFAFVSSANDPTFNSRRETWVRDGRLSNIPLAVGA